MAYPWRSGSAFARVQAVNLRILLVIEERELRDWLRHHLDILWPDATVEDTLPVQFEGTCATWRCARSSDLLSANCGDARRIPTVR